MDNLRKIANLIQNDQWVLFLDFRDVISCYGIELHQDNAFLTGFQKLTSSYFSPGGVMTLHDHGYLPPEFLKSYPVSEWNFQIYTLPRSLAFFRGFLGIYCYANFLCYANFYIVFYCFKTNCFWGGANCLREKPAVSRTMYQNTEKL